MELTKIADMYNTWKLEDTTGYCTFCYESDIQFDEFGDEIDTPEYIKIDYLYVKPECRKGGNGRRILNEALEIIQNEHPDMEIKLVADPDNADEMSYSNLADFYMSCGFEPDENCGDSIILRYAA